METITIKNSKKQSTSTPWHFMFEYLPNSRQLNFFCMLCLFAIVFFFLAGCSFKSSHESPSSTHSVKYGARGTKPYTIKGKTYKPLLSAKNFKENGVASWYGKDFHGKATASGEKYNMYSMTAAHKTLPLGTKVKVINKDNGRAIIVRINDRGPFINGRVIDLSHTGAKKLGMLGPGTAKVEVVSVK